MRFIRCDMSQFHDAQTDEFAGTNYKAHAKEIEHWRYLT
jgi:hypothetical protein